MSLLREIAEGLLVEGLSRHESGLRSVSNALDLLGCFEANEELGVSQLARELGVAKSTVHRLLTALCSRGFAERSPVTGRYRLGLRLHELGALAISRHQLCRTAMPLLQALRAQTGNTVHLAVADGAEIVHIERLESARFTSLFPGANRRFAVHSTSSGKAIAAFDPVCANARLCAGFPAYTPQTIRTARDFERELVLTRRRGFAVDKGETQLGVTSIGAPVRDRSGRALAALSLAAPSALAARHVDQYARLVKQAVTKLAINV